MVGLVSLVRRERDGGCVPTTGGPGTKTAMQGKGPHQSSPGGHPVPPTQSPELRNEHLASNPLVSGVLSRQPELTETRV